MAPPPTNHKVTRNLLVFAHVMLIVLLNVFIPPTEQVTMMSMIIGGVAAIGGYVGSIFYATGPMRREGLDNSKFQTHMLMALSLAELPVIMAIFFMGKPFGYIASALSLAVVLALVLPVSLVFTPAPEEPKP